MGDIIDLDHERGPGRPRKLGRVPSPRQQQQIADHQRSLREHAERDVVVQAASSKARCEALYAARLAVAEEAASMLFSRQNLPPGSREIRQICNRRIEALRMVAELTLAIAKADPGAPSPAMMRKILELLRSEIESAVSEVLDEATAARAVEAFRRRSDAALAHVLDVGL